jgi:hypothetical protein
MDSIAYKVLKIDMFLLCYKKTKGLIKDRQKHKNVEDVYSHEF